MPDTYGAISIPALSQAEGTAAGDPALTMYLAFLKAFLVDDKNLAAAWNQSVPLAPVVPGRPVAPNVPVVRTTIANDPKEYALRESDLPALYLWWSAEPTKNESLGEDYLVTRRALTLLWVMPFAVAANQKPRLPFQNAMDKAIQVAIERGRTPSWKVVGDPDATSQVHGSHVHTLTNVVSCFLASSRASKLQMPIEGAAGQIRPNIKEWAALECKIQLVENLEWGLDEFDPNGGVDQTLTNTAGVVVDREIFT